MENEEIDDLENEANEEFENSVEYRKEQASKNAERADKYKTRFKTEKAKQSQSPQQATSEEFDAKLEAKLAERDFLYSNETARNHINEVREYQTKYNLPIDKAYNLYIAESKPELLQVKPNAGIDGHAPTIKDSTDDWKKMNDDEFYEKEMKKS